MWESRDVELPDPRISSTSEFQSCLYASAERKERWHQMKSWAKGKDYSQVKPSHCHDPLLFFISSTAVPGPVCAGLLSREFYWAPWRTHPVLLDTLTVTLDFFFAAAKPWILEKWILMSHTALLTDIQTYFKYRFLFFWKVMFHRNAEFKKSHFAIVCC